MKKLLLLSLIFLFVLVSGCSHQDKIQLVKKGKTAYSIYVDPSAPESVNKAADDLRSYFIKVTGAAPEIVVTTQIPPTPFISLGSTSALDAAGMDASVIPDNGFRIVTMDGNLYIFGQDTPTGEVNELGGINKGTSYGVYTFIEDYLGVEWLMPGELGEEYDKVNSVSVPVLDRTEYSPFSYRYMSFRMSGPLEDEWDRHMKLGKREEVEFNHSWIETIPPPLFDSHPDWFAQKDGKHVPPSGGFYKLETTNSELIQAFADVIMKTFRKNPDQRWYSLSPSDGGGFSNSPASQALTEKSPSVSEYSISYSPLVFKFYNDVAKIVGKEFPDHKLGGFLYGLYRYPPNAGLQKLEPNLSLMLVGRTQHWRLYLPNMPEINDELMRTWSEYAQRDGFGLYFYDYPNSQMIPNAMISPPTPDHLNFIFSRLGKYEFKGAQIYGNPIWPVSGAGNYILAKLFWDPDQDAHELLKYYCKKAYGAKAAPDIIKIYNVLDTAFSQFYNQPPPDGSSLFAYRLKEIYAENYQAMEDYFLKARSSSKNPKQEERLEMFGQVLSLLQWHLRDLGFLASDYKSALTRSAEEIDHLLSNPHDDFQITRSTLRSMNREDPFIVEKTAPLADAATRESSIVPMYRRVRMLMHVTSPDEVSITIRAFNGNSEFVRYTITNSEGQQLYAGVISEGRTIRFKGEAGKNYFLDIPSRRASMKLEVDGAVIAYKVAGGSISIDGRFMDEALPLYFYVPEEIKSFSITLGTRDAVADVYSPDGRKMAQFNGKSRKVLPVSDSKTGFWKVVIHKVENVGVINIVLDDQLPPWIIPDPANPLVIEKQIEN